MEEQWKDIKGYEGLYQISNLGNVYSNYSKRNLKASFSKTTGYLKVSLCKNKQKKSYNVHRLVAEAFIDNPEPEKYNIVNHKDEDKTNNNVLNLEWCDAQYNNTYGTSIERQKRTKQSIKNPNQKEVWKCDIITHEEIEKFSSVIEAAIKVTNNKNSAAHIRDVCHGRRKSANGFWWKFA